MLQYTGLVLDMLRALPGFVSENKLASGLLALAVATYNAAQIAAQVNTIKSLALQKLVALGVLTEVEGKYSLITATELQTAAQTGLNTALAANPIGFVLTLVAAFIFGLKQLYNRSEMFRASVDSLSAMLRPLGTLLGSLVAKVAPLVGQIGKFFSSLSGGKGILETFGALVGIAVVVPLKLLITQVQLGVDALTDFWDVGKRVANFFGADFQLDPNDSFGNLAKNVKANGQSILNTLTGQDAARAAAEKAAAEQRNRAAFDELSRRTSLQLEAEAKRRAQGQKAADRKADEAKNDLEAEYKAGAISKDKYEAQKAQIEANYDEQTRAAKQKAAETEKEYNIAQAIIQTALSIVKASPNPLLMSVAAVTGAASVAKILATPIPEFEKGGFFGRTWRGVKEYARGGRINTRAGVADVGQRHSGGGIRMVDGATGEHLGEWEKGEAYMILSRDTYANNKHLVDELIDTSLHRGGAPVRRREDYYEDGGTFGGSPTLSATSNPKADGQELVQLLRETRDAIRALPNRQFIAWDQDDTAKLEQRLSDRADDRAAGEVR